MTEEESTGVRKRLICDAAVMVQYANHKLLNTDGSHWDENGEDVNHVM